MIKHIFYGFLGGCVGGTIGAVLGGPPDAPHLLGWAGLIIGAVWAVRYSKKEDYEARCMLLQMQIENDRKAREEAKKAYEAQGFRRV